MVEHAAVNRRVAGSSPARGARSSGSRLRRDWSFRILWANPRFVSLLPISFFCPVSSEFVCDFHRLLALLDRTSNLLGISHSRGCVWFRR